MWNINFDVQVEGIKNLVRYSGNVRILCMDATGQGLPVYNLLTGDKVGGHLDCYVQPVKFTNENKSSMITYAKSIM